MTRPVDPAACRVVLTRHPNGALACIAIVMPEDRPLLAGTEAWGDDEIDRLLRLARQEEDSDPHSDQMPSDGALIRAALRDLGIPIQGEDEDYYDAEGVSEARIQRAMAFGCEPPEEAPHLDPQDYEDRAEEKAKHEWVQDEAGEAPDWRDRPVLVKVGDAAAHIALAGEFCDANKDEPGLRRSIRNLVWGAVDWVRCGGGAAPEVLVTRMGDPSDDLDANDALRALVAKAAVVDDLTKAVELTGKAGQAHFRAWERAWRDRSALLDALRGVVGCLAWHVEEQGRGVAMDAEYLRRARAVVAQAEGRV